MLSPHFSRSLEIFCQNNGYFFEVLFTSYFKELMVKGLSAREKAFSREY